MVLRSSIFFILLALDTALFSGALVNLWNISSHGELYSHIPLIPFVSIYFVFVARKEIFRETDYSFQLGLPLLVAAVLVSWVGVRMGQTLNQNDYLSLMMSGWAMGIISSFVLVYGAQAAKRAIFPLLFLLFAVPIPSFILDRYIAALQAGSAEISYAIFKLLGVPVFRDGFVFSLPGLDIEVAKQCSGIRSSIALVITTVIAGKLFLDTKTNRLLLVISSFPITIFKNSLRIVTLSVLGAYVDQKFITGSWLHSSGGIPFFVVGLILMAPVVWALMKWEKRKASKQ